MPTYSQDLSATSGNAPTKQIGAVDPLTGMPIPLSPTPPPQANTLGTAKPVFNDQTQQFAAGVYGDEISRVQSMPGAQALAQAPLAKLDPMHDGKPGVQKEDFEQFKK